MVSKETQALLDRVATNEKRLKSGSVLDKGYEYSKKSYVKDENDTADYVRRRHSSGGARRRHKSPSSRRRSRSRRLRKLKSKSRKRRRTRTKKRSRK